jgi:hypothetical protein
MSLKDKLLQETQDQRSARDQRDAEQRAQDNIPKLRDAIQGLCTLVSHEFLLEYERERLATIRPLTTKLENGALKSIFFPYLLISMRDTEITLKPIGPVFGSPCRMDLTNGVQTFALLWDGRGNEARNWTMVPTSDDVLVREQARVLSKEGFEKALEELLGL